MAGPSEVFSGFVIKDCLQIFEVSATALLPELQSCAGQNLNLVSLLICLVLISLQLYSS